MKKTLISSLLLFPLSCFGIINYDAGLGFKVVGASSFSGYKLQYNFSPYYANGWTEISMGNSESFEEYLYFSSGIIINTDTKVVFWRILDKSNQKVSDVHQTTIKKRSVNFMKLSLDNGAPETSIVAQEKSYDNSLPYYDICFKTNSFVDNETYLISLLSPERNHAVPYYGAVNFSWQLSPDLQTAVLTSYLIFRDQNNNVIDNIDVTEQFSYNLHGMTYFISNDGVYYWQIVVETNDGKEYASELRPIAIATTNTDSDNDGYYDFYEKYRGSDPNNADDIPGIFDQNNNCPNAIKGCQYSYQFSTKQRQNLLAWSLKGSLPPGLILKTDGTISGIPQETGTFEFVVETHDRKSKWDEIYVTLVVNEASSSEISIK